ncbi:16S rRNA methyltransferase [Dictyobacter arantiisoli]|uniref:16S rRNA (guanine(1405)-N(7))-methyltransferase n=1 Tax=Dictyobacter arantiisoli TaxID=2014874 RepID=A0A5A5TJE5_9CHLR|nr:16S rRNA methyltransferase [Dictyobacter arantiisoli]GCF11365.1 16S rRNA methyltransferase [Dictyobacter arantiisoli]
MFKADKTAALEQIKQDILQSSKYKHICPDLISYIGAQELDKRRTLKEAIKATRSKLHQIGGAYLDRSETFTNWLELLQGALQAEEPDKIKQACAEIMTNHASTRERLPILTEFYSSIFSQLPPIHSVLDIASGLNPLALPWMPLPTNCTYHAYDIYQHMINFINAYFQLSKRPGEARMCDVIQTSPTETVDLALVLKVLPTLEQIEKNAAHRLIHTIHAHHIVVSYPIHSLSGRNKGMAANYEKHFAQLVQNDHWDTYKLEFPTELVFIIQTNQ